MRPKSIATVVVVFGDMPAGSSKPSPTAVMAASVVTGGISDTAPTSVVLPTPKPPATTIFTGIGTTRRAPASGLEGDDAIDQPPDEGDVVARRDRGGRHVEQAVAGEVADEHEGDADRDAH